MDADVHMTPDYSGRELDAGIPSRSSEQLTIRQHRDGDVLTLHVGGALDTITVPRLATALEIALAAGDTLLILDLTDVSFLSATGINLLVDVQRLTAGYTTAMRVVAAGPFTRRPLQVLGVDTFLELYPSVTAAMQDVPRT